MTTASESVSLLVARTRVGLWLVLTSIILFALVDPVVNAPVLGPLSGIKALQVACAIGAFRALRGPVSRRRVIVTGVLAASVFSVTTALAGILADDGATTPVLLVVLGMGTAILLPWGVWPQVAVQAVVAASILLALGAVSDPGAGASLPFAVFVASAVAVYAAHTAERYQRERLRVAAAETELRARQHQAGMAQAARLSTLGGMAAGLAQQINQPLSAIVSYASGSARRIRGGHVEPPALLEVVDSIADEAMRAGEILRRIRGFVRNTNAARSRADLNDLVREALHFAEVEAREQRIVLRLALSPVRLLVDADAMQLEQVILHLVSNGFEAMADIDAGPRELTIETRTRGDGGAELIVRDTGCGVTHAAATRLFDPFFSTRSDGLGLGLPVSRSIVEAHGGRIWAATNAPRGAAFHVVLPEARGHRDAA